MDDLESKIRPLVEALNKTELVQTFSSCEGHFAPDEQTIVDRNHAEVRFIPAPDTSVKAVEDLLASLLKRFKAQYGLIPVKLTGYKLFTPIDDKTVEETFVLELRPFNRFDSPDRKRSDVDRAIGQVVSIVVAWLESRAAEG